MVHQLKSETLAYEYLLQRFKQAGNAQDGTQA